MTHLLEDNNRRDINFANRKVREVLPEFYLSEYPTLVTFLEKYYNYLDSSTTGSFGTEINNLFSVRDISVTEEQYLDALVSEIGNGLQVASFFDEPRLMTKLLSSFYRSKGSVVSVEGFFRAFFNSEVVVEYPKDQIFIVGESEIGAESLKFIISNTLYQTFSILIKSGISVSDYEELYKRFVHPAGFFFAGQAQLEGIVDLGFDSMPNSEEPLDSAQNLRVLTADIAPSATPITGFAQLTGLYDSQGDDMRIDLSQILSTYEDISSTQLDSFYQDISELLSPNSFKFDDSDVTIRPDMSLNTETMDNTMFTRYLSDSAI